MITDQIGAFTTVLRLYSAVMLLIDNDVFRVEREPQDSGNYPHPTGFAVGAQKQGMRGRTNRLVTATIDPLLVRVKGHLLRPKGQACR
ncbi:hypothetical protein BN903_136 [Halorubrum sp. AJ67]|nr:hypothetical protein BN903_136 [Halorubrum sp. AJ67]